MRSAAAWARPAGRRGNERHSNIALSRAVLARRRRSDRQLLPCAARSGAGRRPGPSRRVARQAAQHARCSTPGSASTPTAPSRCSPARRARPRHQDRADPARGRGARASSPRRSARHRRYGRTPNEGYTAGSQSMQDSGTAIRHAAAQVREILIGRRREALGDPAAQLTARAAQSSRADGRASLWRAGRGQVLHVEAQPKSKLKEPGARTASSASRCRASTFRPR